MVKILKLKFSKILKLELVQHFCTTVFVLFLYCPMTPVENNEIEARPVEEAVLMAVREW